MLFNYELKTNIGTASGTLEANSEKEAKAILKENHSGKYVGDNGHEYDNKIVELKLESAL